MEFNILFHKIVSFPLQNKLKNIIKFKINIGKFCIFFRCSLPFLRQCHQRKELSYEATVHREGLGNHP